MKTDAKSSVMLNRISSISLVPNDSIRKAMQRINEGGLGLVVLIGPEDGRFMGLVTDGDIRRALLSGQGLESPVNNVKRPETLTAKAGTPYEALESLFSERVRVIPLLDGQGYVVDLAVFDRRIRLPLAQPSLTEKELRYVSECVLTGWISSAGKFVTRFEEMVASHCNSKYAVATSNGTTALHLALLALGIGSGDEVIVPTLTFIASANAVTYTGAKPVFVDSEKESWNLDPAQVEKALTARTKAIMPVHLYGHPANMGPLLELAEQHNLKIIEDAAEAQGALYKGRHVGGLGDVGIFSFYGNKIITTGEGGMVVTNDETISRRARMLRDHGMDPDRRYWHPVLGYNYRMTNLQAAVGVAQMESIDTILKIRSAMAQHYTELLSDLPGVTLPPCLPWADTVCWLYSIVIDPQIFGCSRDQLIQSLNADGIDSRPLFPCVHSQPIYSETDRYPIAQQLSKNGISLPSFTTMSNADIERICLSIRARHG